MNYNDTLWCFSFLLLIIVAESYIYSRRFKRSQATMPMNQCEQQIKLDNNNKDSHYWIVRVSCPYNLFQLLVSLAWCNHDVIPTSTFYVSSSYTFLQLPFQPYRCAMCISVLSLTLSFIVLLCIIAPDACHASERHKQRGRQGGGSRWWQASHDNEREAATGRETRDKGSGRGGTKRRNL